VGVRLVGTCVAVGEAPASPYGSGSDSAWPLGRCPRSDSPSLLPLVPPAAAIGVPARRTYNGT
jgi:hypothetical protein